MKSLKKGMASEKSILDEPIEEINVPVLRPTRYVPRRRPAILVERTFDRFADWIMTHVPEPRRINERIRRLREEIRQIYTRYDEHTLYEREAPLRGFLRTYRIDGRRGYDQRTFTEYIRPRVIEFLNRGGRPFQTKFILTCKFKKGKEYNYGYFHTNVERIMEDTNLADLYNIMIAMMLEKISQFQNKGSGWSFDSIVSFDINVDPYDPLNGSSYFPLPAKLERKKGDY